jgi:glutamyl-tRNA reductase
VLQDRLTALDNDVTDLGSSGESGILLLSVSHHSAPVSVRERLAFDADTRNGLLRDIIRFASEAIVIGTCNRTEIYVASADGDTHHRALSLLERLTGSDAADLATHVRIERGRDAVLHIMRVAAGIDSAILGEPQILGQVRASLDEARAAGCAGPVLTRLFQSAIAAGKRARSETRISQGAGSISHAAVELAREAFGSLAQRRALAIGLGEMGHLVARNLRAHGVSDLLLCNRTFERSAAVASEIDARAIPWGDLDQALGNVDIVISATGAHDQVISRVRLAQARDGRESQSLLIVDIAVPRDIDPTAGSLPGVHLYDIDSLHAVRSANLRERESEIPRVEAIVQQESDGFRRWKNGHDLSGVIAEFYEMAEATERQEVELALSRLGHLSERDREVVRILARRLTRKLLHQPVTRLKAERSPQDAAEVLQRLFDLPWESGDD